MRVLITGITGFVGSHLAEHLLSSQPDVELFGLRRWRSSTEEIEGILPVVRLLEGDLLDAPSLIRAVQASRPDVVFHLAASSSVANSWDTPTQMMQANVIGTLQLLEAARQMDLDAPVVLACSAEPYGAVAAADLPIREDHPLRPVSPYAVSKAAVDLLGVQYYESYRLRTVRLRLFNHFGPRQSDRFVMGSLAHQVAEIEANLRPPQIRVGNLDVKRDFVDVRDAARAYWLAATRGVAGEVYNVATGRARSIHEVLDLLLSMTDAVIDVAFDPGRLRPAEIPVLEGDASRFRRAVGWEPAITFEQTLYDTLEHWRRRIRSRP
jgi:GDP-4-dehydro-6-deoxy-D-mannose reductase